MQSQDQSSKNNQLNLIFFIAILAWIFLAEGITLQQIIGMAVAAVGAVLVQLRVRKRITH